MNKKQFELLLKALGKNKKVEEETVPKSQTEIKARTGKTFYEIFMEDRDEK